MFKINGKNTRATTLTVAFCIFKTSVAIAADYLKKFLKIDLKNLTYLIRSELNKVEATRRCSTECVQKTYLKKIILN